MTVNISCIFLNERVVLLVGLNINQHNYYGLWKMFTERYQSFREQIYGNTMRNKWRLWIHLDDGPGWRSDFQNGGKEIDRCIERRSRAIEGD